jgi:hypothetical protein
VREYRSGKVSLRYIGAAAMVTVESLRARLDTLRASLARAQAHSDKLASHVVELKQLVDGAGTRHAAWESRLASMVDSDTRRSAAVARRQESLAAQLGIRPRGTTNPFWRAVQHVLFIIGLTFSVVLVGPFSALKRWSDKRAAAAAADARSGAGLAKSENERSRAPSRVHSAVYLRDPRLVDAGRAGGKTAGLEAPVHATAEGVGSENVAVNAQVTEWEHRQMAQGESLSDRTPAERAVASSSSSTLATFDRPPGDSREVGTPQAEDGPSANEHAGKDADCTGRLTPGPRSRHRRRLSWANRDHLIAGDIDETSEDTGDVNFWNAFDS